MEGWAVRSGLPCKTPIDGGGVPNHSFGGYNPRTRGRDKGKGQGMWRNRRGRDKERGETEGADKERDGKEGTERHRLTSSRPISFKATKR